MAHDTNPQAWADAHKKAGWSETRLPLPGLYPCLTLQANVTLHKATGLGKYVMVLREPTEHVELTRTFRDLDPWGEVARPAMVGFETMLADMGTLMGLSGNLFKM